MGSQKKRKKKIKAGHTERSTEHGRRGFMEYLDMPDREFLRGLPSYAGYKDDFCETVLSWSDSRSWIDLSPGMKRRARISFQGLFLVALAVLLMLWFSVSFIYRMSTEADAGKVALSMLPSLIIVAACSAILLVSYFGAWGKFVRWGFRHNFIRGRDAADRHFNRKFKEEIDRADSNKLIECAIDVTEEYVILTVYGQIYPFLRSAVSLTISKQYDMLHLVFTIDGKEFVYPKNLPKNLFVCLNKAFGGKVTVEKNEEKREKINFAREIPFIIVALGIVAVSVLAIVAHYLWIPQLPPIIGVFFLLMSGLVFCNIFSDIQLVSEVGIPFVFSVVLLVTPPMAYVWIETELMKSEITFLHVLTHCTPFAAGFGFFFVLGFYTFSFAISKAVDFVRFGR